MNNGLYNINFKDGTLLINEEIIPLERIRLMEIMGYYYWDLDGVLEVTDDEYIFFKKVRTVPKVIKQKADSEE